LKFSFSQQLSKDNFGFKTIKAKCLRYLFNKNHIYLPMYKTFTFSSKHLSPDFFKLHQKMTFFPHMETKRNITVIRKSPPSLSLNLILGYAAALSVVHINKELKFDIIQN